MGNLLRKILVILIIVLPAISYSGCKKQKKCGCGKDVLFSFTNEPCYVYFNETGTIITLQTVNDMYSQYTFCNPVEIFPKLEKYKSGDQLMVSGNVYWDCNYVWQSSNQSYQTSMYKVYNIAVTNVYLDMYGKK
jgi:hypothetical protein